MVVYFGRRVTGPSGGLALVDDGMVRAVVHDPAGKNLWAKRFGVRAGRFTATTPTIRMVARNVDSNKRPNARVGYSNTVSAGTAMTSGSGGTVYTPDVGLGENSLVGAAIMIFKSNRYSLEIVSDVASTGVAMEPAADVSYPDEHFYTKTGITGSMPPADYTGYTISNEGMLNIWLECDENEPPLVPASRAPSGSISTNRPEFTGSFRDNNGRFGTDVGDRLKQVEIWVRKQSDNSEVWHTKYTASEDEVAADQFTKLGPVMPAGALEWKCRVSDQFGEWSAESSWLYFENLQAGFVTLDGTPSGKTDNLTPDFQFRWNHASGLDMARARLQLYEGDSLIRTDTRAIVVPSSTLPGTLATYVWSGTGLDPLTPGKLYKYVISGQIAADTENWYVSNKRSFTVDAAPTIPSNPSPSSGSTVSNLPKISVSMTDKDDTVASGLVCKLAIRSSINIDNGTFDANITGWQLHSAAAGVTATLSWDGTINNSGSGGSLKVAVTASTAGAGSGPYYRTTQRWPVVAGLPYEFNRYIRTSNANLKPLMCVFWYDASDVLLSISTPEADSTPPINTFVTTSNKASLTFTAPANAAYARIGFRVFNTTANQTGNVWVDDVVAVGVSQRRVRNMTLRAGTTTRWDYQITSDDYPGFDTYHHNAYGGDGFLWSGGALTEALATWSPTFSLEYVSAPTITITAPTEAQVLTSATINITWTLSSSTQTQYKVRVYRASDDELLWASNGGDWTVSTVMSASVPIGSIPLNGDYYIVIDSNTALGVVSTSSPRAFTLDVPNPSATTLYAEAVTLTNSDQPIAVRLSWDEPTVTGEVVKYILRRDDLADPLYWTEDPTDLLFYDATIISGAEYSYTLTYIVDNGGVLLESDPAEQVTGITLVTPVLTSVESPSLYAFAMNLLQDAPLTDAALENVYTPPRGSDPVTISRPGRTRTIALKLTIAPVYGGLTGKDQKELLEALLYNGGPLFCYRDELQEKEFVRVSSSVITPKGMDVYEVAINCRRERYSEGMPL
jgi:hypothetical protein